MPHVHLRDRAELRRHGLHARAERQTVLVVGRWPSLDGEHVPEARIESAGVDLHHMHGSLLLQHTADAPAPHEQVSEPAPEWLLIGRVAHENRLPDIVAKWRMRVPSARLAMLGSHKDRYRAESWIRRGCTVYLADGSPLERVLNALYAATQLDLQIFDHSLYLRWQRSMPEMPNLTPRQQEVLQLIVRGYTNAEIARELFLTHHTIEFHIRHLLQNLGVRNRTEAAERARIFGLY